MKLKNKYKVISLIFILAFIGLSIFALTKKDKVTTTTKTSDASKYLISFNNPDPSQNGCSRYYNNAGNKIFSYGEVEEKFPVYTVDSCATTLSDYIARTGDKDNACRAQYNYITQDQYGHGAGYWHQFNEYDVSVYNNSCSDSSSGRISLKTINEIQNEIKYTPVCQDPRDTTSDTESWPHYGVAFRSSYNNTIGETYGFPIGEYLGMCPDKKNQACRVYYNYAKRVSINDSKSIDEYNHYCGDYNRLTPVSWRGLTCNELKEKLKTEYVDYQGEKDWYNENCGSSGTPFNTSEISRQYYNKENNFTCAPNRINYYGSKDNLVPTMVLKAKNGINTCDFNVYYYKGAAWEFDKIIESDMSLDKKQEMCTAKKEEITGKVNEYYDFNRVCIDSGILDESNRMNLEPTIDIIFSAQNATNKMSCPTSSNSNYTIEETGVNECTYHVKISYLDDAINGKKTITLSELPKTNGLEQLTTHYKFDGWRRGSETTCNKGTTISLELTKDITVINYNACFKEIESIAKSSYTLYKSCNGDFIDGKDNNETKGINDVSNQAILNNKIISSQEYVSAKTDDKGAVLTQSATHGNSFNLNTYCSISCEETVEYKYPSIFETVKSGTYFDLLSYPEITSYLTCSEHFEQSRWQNDYNNKIIEEKNAYAKYLTSQSIDSMTASANGTSRSCGCARANSDGDGCAVYNTQYVGTATLYTYDSVSNSFSSTSRSFTDCSSDISNAKSAARGSFSVGNLGGTKYYAGQYVQSVNNRVSLEKAEMSCAYAMTTDKDNKKMSFKSAEVNSLNKTQVNYTSYDQTFKGVSEDDFYKVDPKISFLYEDSNKKINEEELGKSSSYTQDTNIHDYNVDTISYHENNGVPININYGDYNYSFTPVLYSKEYFIRTVTRNFVFTYNTNHKDYYTYLQSGKVLDKDSIPKTDNNKVVHIGKVYPISLTSSGDRNVYFSIEFNSNLNYGGNALLKNLNITNPPNKNSKNVYSCDYKITNDVVIKDKNNEDKFKKNFYIRSISTQDVDPNDRRSQGLLGANWTSDKGKALIDLIEAKSQNKNTQSPDNLEYSFTINAQTIDMIKEYNKNNHYDDFNLICNAAGGECTSLFLKALSGDSEAQASIKVSWKNLSSVNAYMKKNTDPTWKYYINDNNNYKWVTVKSLKELSRYDKNNLCKKSINDNKKYYDCLYRNVNKGVLP